MSEKIEIYNVLPAVCYWLTFLEEPTLVNFNNGATDPANMMVANLVKMANRSASYPEDEKDKFKTALTEYIIEKLESDGSCSFSVDYDPDRALTEILDKTITNYISKNVFPCKTNMKITCHSVHDIEVMVSEGYGADFKEVHPLGFLM